MWTILFAEEPIVTEDDNFKKLNQSIPYIGLMPTICVLKCSYNLLSNEHTLSRKK